MAKRSDRRWRTTKKVISRMEDAKNTKYISMEDDIEFYEYIKGKSKKTHPFDCGNPKCKVCNYEKLMKIKSHHDAVREEKSKKEIKDFFENSAG